MDRFCQAVLLQVPAGLQRDHLVGALQCLFDHHDALRLRLTGSEAPWSLEVAPAGAVVAGDCLRRIDICGLDDAGLHACIVEAAPAAERAGRARSAPRPGRRGCRCRRAGARGGSSGAPAGSRGTAAAPARPGACLRGCAPARRRSRGSASVRSATATPRCFSRLRCCAGDSAWSKTTTSAWCSCTISLISSALPEPTKSAGSGALRRAITRATGDVAGRFGEQRQFVERRVEVRARAEVDADQDRARRLAARRRPRR